MSKWDPWERFMEGAACMTNISLEEIRAYRQSILPDRSIHSMEECLAAVNRLGMVWPFTPGNGLLPALFPALATENEGQCWDWIWPWKDRLAASRQAYYGKVVGGKPTFVSLEWLGTLYALTGNTGDLDDDLVAAGEQVRLHEMAIKVYQYIREYGPTGTRTLLARLSDGSRPMKSAVEKGIEQLDRLMLIVKSGTEGGNSIANIWDLFLRFHPEAVEAGTDLSTREAALRLLQHYFVLTPAVQGKQLEQLFPWNKGHQEKAIARLQEAGEIQRCLVEGKPGYCRPDLITTVA